MRSSARAPFRAVWAVACVVVASCGGGGGGGDGGPRGGGGQPGPIAEDLASVAPTPLSAARNSEPGAFAADFIRGTNFTTLTIEVDYPESRPPTPAALDFLRERLLERVDKLDVVIVVDDAIPDDRFPFSLSVSEVQDIEDEYRDTVSDSSSKTAAAYLLYVRGKSDDDQGSAKVLGMAHRGGSVVLFVDNADDSTSALMTNEDFEAAGVLHELGHLLGLVNGGIPMVEDHEDLEHPFHTTDFTCVMFWLVGGIVPSGFHLGDDEFARFGPFSVQDIQAFGGN
jgi:hypothetical protein